MKTFNEQFEKHIDINTNTVQLTEEMYKQLLKDTITVCKNLCEEGENLFKEINKGASIGCGACADNMRNLLLTVK